MAVGAVVATNCSFQRNLAVVVAFDLPDGRCLLPRSHFSKDRLCCPSFGDRHQAASAGLEPAHTFSLRSVHSWPSFPCKRRPSAWPCSRTRSEAPFPSPFRRTAWPYSYPSLTWVARSMVSRGLLLAAIEEQRSKHLRKKKERDRKRKGEVHKLLQQKQSASGLGIDKQSLRASSFDKSSRNVRIGRKQEKKKWR